MSKIKTITGSVWLDKLTSPYWRFMGWRAERKLCKLLGQGDIQRGRAVLKEALALDFMSEIVGTYNGTPKTLQDLWDDYLKEVVEIAAVAVSAIQDLDLGVAQIDDASFHDIWQETLSTIEGGNWDRENPTEWVTDIGREYGYVCLHAGINDLSLFRRSLIWLTATCIAAYSDMTDQTPYDQPWEFVVAERHRQDAKWGEQHHSPKGWLPILGEEFGEMCEAAMRIDYKMVQALDGGNSV